MGDLLSEDYSLDQPVTMEIDEEKRILNMKCHSKGHLIDLGVMRLPLPYELEAGKGYHFPEGPYVEYNIKGTFDPN